MNQFQNAIDAIDSANADDPQGKETLYSQRMTAWLERIEPGATEALRLAARAQHVRRWEISRQSYPADRAGYHAWRRRLYDHHADCAAGILEKAGYDDQTIASVRSLLRKERIKTDADAQTLEDVACLVFLENEFADFRARKDYEDEKWIHILRRTWAKMSPRGHDFALKLELDEASRGLIEKALKGD